MLKSFSQRIALAACFALAPAVLMSAPTPTQAQDVQVPATVDDHLALAKSYLEKATTYRKEAQYHRQMFEAYKKSVPAAGKSPQPNPWLVKMQKHCQTLVKDAEKLAVDSEKAAEYHTFRAKELQGK